MSRVIKFRAWTGKQMMYQDKQYLASFIRRAVLQINLDHERGFSQAHEAYLPDGKSIDDYLMQYTGLTDCNGKEIYEGDVLRMQNATATVVFWGKPPEFGLDYYHNEDEWCEDWNLSDDSECMEVIGNIYETPELVRQS